MTLPRCPKCQSEFTYEDGALYICPECAHEWAKAGALQAILYEVNNTFGETHRYLLQLDTLDTGAMRYPQYPDLLWQSLSALTDSQLESLRTGASQATLGWLELAQLSRRYIGKPEALQQAFTDWQRRYVQLSSRLTLPAALRELLNLTPYQPQRIAKGGSERFSRALKTEL